MTRREGLGVYRAFASRGSECLRGGVGSEPCQGWDEATALDAKARYPPAEAGARVIKRKKKTFSDPTIRERERCESNKEEEEGSSSSSLLLSHPVHS